MLILKTWPSAGRDDKMAILYILHCHTEYPLVDIQKHLEHHHYNYKWSIINSYVKLPEGILFIFGMFIGVPGGEVWHYREMTPLPEVARGIIVDHGSQVFCVGCGHPHDDRDETVALR